MRKLIEITHVSLGGRLGHSGVGTPIPRRGTPGLTARQLFEADSLLLGRLTYEGFSAAYPTMSGAIPAFSLNSSDA